MSVAKIRRSSHLGPPFPRSPLAPADLNLCLRTPGSSSPLSQPFPAIDPQQTSHPLILNPDPCQRLASTLPAYRTVTHPDQHPLLAFLASGEPPLRSHASFSSIPEPRSTSVSRLRPEEPISGHLLAVETPRRESSPPECSSELVSECPSAPSLQNLRSNPAASALMRAGSDATAREDTPAVRLWVTLPSPVCLHHFFALHVYFLSVYFPL